MLLRYAFRTSCTAAVLLIGLAAPSTDAQAHDPDPQVVIQQQPEPAGTLTAERVHVQALHTDLRVPHDSTWEQTLIEALPDRQSAVPYHALSAYDRMDVGLVTLVADDEALLLTVEQVRRTGDDAVARDWTTIWSAQYTLDDASPAAMNQGVTTLAEHLGDAFERDTPTELEALPEDTGQLSTVYSTAH